MSGREMRYFNQRVKRAFTLLEVMLVIVLVIALMAVVVPNIGGRRERALIGATEIQLRQLENALEAFRNDVGRFPTTEEGVESLVNSDRLQDDALVRRWHGPYLDRQFKTKDSWDRDFIYAAPGQNNTTSFDLSSRGPDGQEGTDDDIVNWDTDDRRY